MTENFTYQFEFFSEVPGETSTGSGTFSSSGGKGRVDVNTTAETSGNEVVVTRYARNKVQPMAFNPFYRYER